MAIIPEFPTLNGIAPSWADIRIKITPSGFPGLGAVAALPGIETREIAALNTSRSVDVGNQYGASGGRKMKRTTGQGDQESSITFYRSGYQKFLRLLLAAAPPRGNQRVLTLVHFDIIQQHSVPGDVSIYERVIKGARVIGDTMNSAEGSDAQQVEVPLSVIEIADIIDGQEVVLL